MNKTTVADIPVIWLEPKQSLAKIFVIWLPGFSGNKEAMLPQLSDLAKAGFVAVSFDPYQHGERRIESQEALRARIRGNIRRYFWPILAHTAEETSTIIDWAIARFGVEAQIGMGGISMGGDISIAAAGIDQRITAVAACIATPDWMRPGSFEPPGWPDEAAQTCYDRRNPLTHLDHYAHCPAISFQSGAKDEQVPPDGGQRFIAALNTRYDCGDKLDVTLHSNTAHKFTPNMWHNCLKWFANHLQAEGHR